MLENAKHNRLALEFVRKMGQVGPGWKINGPFYV